MSERVTADLPVGSSADSRPRWVPPRGVVARELTRHPLRAQHGADGASFAASLDDLGGNTMLGMRLCRLAPDACGPPGRRLAETLVYVVAGRGRTQVRQCDDEEPQTVEWRAGDLLAVPANAWRQHRNTDPAAPARRLTFSNRPLLRALLGGPEQSLGSPFRFAERYADEHDYWERREIAPDGAVVTNLVHDLLTEPLPPAGRLGRFMSARRYRMGGHLTLDVSVLEIGHRGHVARHRHLVEEGIYVLSGRGRTIITADDGRETTFRWRAGDLISPPLDCWHQHISEAKAAHTTRLLAVRGRAIEEAFAAGGDTLGTVIPDRSPTLIEPDYADPATVA